MKIKEISNKYVSDYKTFDESKEKIESKIQLRQKQIERLERKMERLEKTRPWWIDMIIKPIAEELTKELENVYYDILGPFGISAETSIHFYPDEFKNQDRKEWNWDNVKSITFIPYDLKNGEIGIRDYTKNTGKFAKGTIGELNGLNHPTIELDTSMEIKDLLKFIN
jgi:hypothetical protein